MRVSFQIPVPHAGLRPMKWKAGNKYNGGINAPPNGAYVLRVQGDFFGNPKWEWDYKSEGEFIEHGRKVLIY